MWLSKWPTPTIHIFICTGHSVIVQQPPVASVLYRAVETLSTSELNEESLQAAPPDCRSCSATGTRPFCSVAASLRRVWRSWGLWGASAFQLLSSLSPASHPSLSLSATVFGHCLYSLAFFPLNPLFCLLISWCFSLYHPVLRFSFLLFFFFFLSGMVHLALKGFARESEISLLNNECPSSSCL